MKRLLIYLAIAITAIGVFSYWYFRPARVVKRNTLALLSELTISPETGCTPRIMKGSALANYFSSPTTLHSKYDFANGSFEQGEINDGCEMFAQQASSFTVVPHDDMAITVTDTKATVTFSADVKAKVAKWIEVVDDSFTITIHWKKADKGWKVTESAWKTTP